MTKIEALKRTIYNLENNMYSYSWTDIESCNCGVLARTLLGGKGVCESGFLDSPKVDNSLCYFSEYAYCMTTDLKLPLVFQVLKDAGFTHSELDELENCGNRKVIERCGGSGYQKVDRFINYQRDNKTYLIFYLKAWVEILEQSETIEPTHDPIIDRPFPADKTKVITKYVSVPATILEKEELIFN